MLSRAASEYRIDNGEWISLNRKNATPAINSGQKISFKITNPTITSTEGISRFIVNKAFNVEGNIMSLFYGDNFEGQIDLSGKNNVFYKLFNNCTTLKSVENLILPATTLADDCYSYMFYGCTSLTTAPKVLPATTLADDCYSWMFYGCTSLTEAPELPATTLVSSCYSRMFSDCTSLTTAPQLPATTLARSCYGSMFYGCTSLVETPLLPATTLVDYCYSNMFYGCSNLNKITMLATNISAMECLQSWAIYVASSGTFVKHPNMTTLPTGTSGIPSGWTVINDGEESDTSKNLITFTVDGVEYQAEEGMTWEEWVNSEYNTGTFVCQSNNNYVSYQYNGRTTYVATGQYGSRVNKTSTIDPSKNYTHYSSAPASL